ncbi:hypothetical protein L195_g052391, partial [Trifolium pratense]
MKGKRNETRKGTRKNTHEMDDTLSEMAVMDDDAAAAMMDESEAHFFAR